MVPSSGTQAKPHTVRVSVFKIPGELSVPSKQTRYYAACDCGWFTQEYQFACSAFDEGERHLPECKGAR